MKRNTFFTLPGFTLVELLLVMAIISIVATIGVVNVVEYNRNQTFIAATNGIYSALQFAKQRAQAQVTAGCTSLTGYQVQLNNAGNAPCTGSTACYAVTPVCSGSVTSTIKQLPSGYTFSNATNSFTFNVLSGSVTGASSNGTKVTVSGNSKSKDFFIYSDGRIQ